MSDGNRASDDIRHEDGPEVDELTPEIRDLLDRFSAEEIATGVIQGRASDSGREEAETYNPQQLRGELADALMAQSLGQLIRSARASAGLSLAAVGDRLGVSRGRVHQLEREGANVEIDTLRRVADALGYDVRVMFIPREREGASRVAPLDPMGSHSKT